MKVGIFIGVTSSVPTLEGVVQQVVATEDDGFDSLWSTQSVRDDALTMLALAGQRTKRIELGTAVVPLRIPRYPLALAQAALTTQAATGGRLILGVGAVSKAAMEDWPGGPTGSPETYMREYISVMRALVHEGKVDFSGQVFRINTGLEVPGATPFPIMVAALGPKMLRMAGEMTEGTITWMVGRKNLETHIIPRITASARDAGRPNPRICVGVPIAVTDDPAAARETADRLFERYAQSPHYRRMLNIEGADSPAGVSVIGNEAEVEEQLRSFAGTGATDLLASIFSVGDDAEASVARTRALLKSLVGKI